MNTCPICGIRNPDSNVRCFQCQALLRQDANEYAKSVRQADASMRRDRRARMKERISELLARILPRRLRELPQDLVYRFPWTAAGLSIIPGAGQLYNHQPVKAAVFAGGWWTGAALCVLMLTQPYSNLLLLVLLFFYLVIWNDALATAVRINGQDWPLRNSLAALFALMFTAGMAITGLQFLLPFLILLALIVWVQFLGAMLRPDGSSTRSRIALGGTAVFLVIIVVLARQSDTERVFTLVHVIKDVHAPVIDDGDIVLVNNTAYWFQEPRFGEMVHFDPGVFTIERRMGRIVDIYRINIQDYFQRIVGMPGDRIVKKGDKYFRNGEPFPAGVRPIRDDVLFDGTFEVPSGKYFCPITTIPADDPVVLAQKLGWETRIDGETGGVYSPRTMTGEGILQRWFEASCVSKDDIKGHAIAVINPPTHRQWLKQ